MSRTLWLVWCCNGDKYEDAFFAGVAAVGGGRSSLVHAAGSADDVITTGTGGTVLMGGGRDVDAAFGWMIERSGNGDELALRARGTDAYNPYIT